MVEGKIACRAGCGACCIHISISSSMPNHPNGKPAGVPCANLNAETMMCNIWNDPDFPDICRRFNAVDWICGSNYQEAMENIINLEKITG
jgi:uncharacterized protein